MSCARRLALLWKRIMGTQVLRVLEPADLVGDIASVRDMEVSTRASNSGKGSVVEAETPIDPGHGICSQNPTPCGCLRVYVHASPKAPPGQRLTVCVINLGSTSQDVRKLPRGSLLGKTISLLPLASVLICIAVASSQQRAELLSAWDTRRMFHCDICTCTYWCR